MSEADLVVEVKQWRIVAEEFIDQTGRLRAEIERLREVGVQAFLMGFSRGKDVPITGFPPDGQLNEWAHQAVDEIARAALEPR